MSRQPAGRRRFACSGAGLLAIVAVVAISGLLSCGGAQRRPDVVVVVIDTLRPDHLGFLDYARDTAPFLASLAEGAVTFRRAFAASTWTPPSTASLFTSRYPTEHGVLSGFFVRRRHGVRQGDDNDPTVIRINRIPESMPTLPEVFRDQGYTTWGISANVNIGPEIGFDRGFDHFARLHNLRRRGASTAEAVAAKLREWGPGLRDGGPNFVYLHFNDPHIPYNERQPWYSVDAAAPRLERVVGAYDSEISYIDRTLAELLPEFGWDREAILAVLSDHGEEFSDHGGSGHKATLYGELLRVLFVIQAPGVEAASVDNVNVSLIDVLPTLVELAGLDAAEGWRGVSLAPLLRHPRGRPPAQLRRRSLYAYRGGPRHGKWAVIRGDWKLIRTRKRTLLYHVGNDPLDQNNLAADRGDLLSRLTADLDLFRSEDTFSDRVVTEVHLATPEVEALRSLGYVQ